MIPTEIAPSACNRLKFSKILGRRRDPSLFHSISSAIRVVPESARNVRTWSISCETLSRFSPFMIFSIANLNLGQSSFVSVLRNRCVPLASPPPPAMISSIGIVVSDNGLPIRPQRRESRRPDCFRVRVKLNLKALGYERSGILARTRPSELGSMATLRDPLGLHSLLNLPHLYIASTTCAHSRSYGNKSSTLAHSLGPLAFPKSSNLGVSRERITPQTDRGSRTR